MIIPDDVISIGDLDFLVTLIYKYKTKYNL